MRPVWRIGPERRLSFETGSYRLIIEAQAESGGRDSSCWKQGNFHRLCSVSVSKKMSGRL